MKAIVAFLLCGVAMAAPASDRAAQDPFGQATGGYPGCSAPVRPTLTAEEAAKDAHWRAERGTSCYRSGRCRLPNAYLYDAEILPRALRYVQQDGRFSDTSVWLTVQRRWIIVQGCVRSLQQAQALEAALRLIDDVEAVIPQLSTGTQAETKTESRKNP